MQLSYWEQKSWFTNVDFTIVGSGIVGLSCALHIKKRFPKATILILEKGLLPQGASTKNAGFACFGSLSEILDDLKTHSEQDVYKLVEKRWNGLQILRKHLGDATIHFKEHGGYELYTEKEVFEKCFTHKDKINTLLKPLFKNPVFTFCPNHFNFSNIEPQYAFNQYEGQLDTGKMMEALLLKVQCKGIKIVNGCEVIEYQSNTNSVHIKTNLTTFTSNKLLLATNGFSQQFIQENVQPARAQVLITKPIKNLDIKGTFHVDKGYYYFRNIANRILLGGGRNLDFETENTTKFGETTIIQQALENLLKTTILPTTPFEIEHRWSGIMGVGKQKKAIVKPLAENVYCGIRLGGMGVAIGSLIGKELAALL